MEPVVKVKDLVQKTGRRTVLNGISFEVYPGECFAVFGAGGSGKTALIHVLAGVDAFTSGEVEVLGANVKKSGAFKRSTGLVTQKRSLFGQLTAAENLDFLAALKGAPTGAIPDLVGRLQLEEHLKSRAAALEEGAYRRLSLACALLNSPRLLLADEITERVDPHSLKVIINEIKSFLAGGGTVVWALADPSYLHLATSVGWLEGGRMEVLEPTRAVRKLKEALGAALGTAGSLGGEECAAENGGPCRA